MSRPYAIIPSRPTWYPPATRLVRLALVLVITIANSLIPQKVSRAQTSWQWYKTDLHAHSVISADAFDDLGIMSRAAKLLGYNALFLTDHNLASEFPISSLTANDMKFEDSYTRWTSAKYGSPTSTTNALNTSPVNTGARSLHLGSTSSGYGESFVWTNRGPNFRSGDIILKFSVYPTRIDPGSGVYVSASIGGDITVQSPDGYTTSSGVISPGKSVVMVWQLGSPRSASSTDVNRRVLTYPLAYTLNRWNHYTINISDYLADIPAAELPLDYNALTYLKMAAAGNGGTADAYFDTYSITASAPVSPANEFVYRNRVIRTYDTSTFKIFPSLEMGVSKHAQRFNFDITDPSQFLSYSYGVDGILPAQQSGYPAMLNHPGSSGGTSDQETINTRAAGADLMEVRQQAWIDNWDAIHQQGVQVLGTGTSDTHRVFSGSSFATYVYGPELTFDSLVHSIFDGRTYVAAGSFGDQGRVILNLDSSSQEPYPARYPVYVSGTQTSANVHLSVSGGLRSGYTVRWLRNGIPVATDSPTGVSYEATKPISLSGSWTTVRAEVRDAAGEIKALTQPIMFVTVPNLPAGYSYFINHVSTANGRQYTKLFVKGVTSSSWDAVNQALTLTLQNPANALVDLRMRTGAAPQSVQVDGNPIPFTDSRATFEASSGSIGYYDGAAGLLSLKVLHAAATSTVRTVFANSGTTTAAATLTTSTFTPTQTNVPATLVFGPAADTYVQSDQSTANFGASAQLVTDNSPARNLLLKFAVSGVGTRTVVSAKLRIYCTDSSPFGGSFYRVADTTWNEGTVNWTNAPIADPNSLASLGPVVSGTWYEVDLSSLINGDGLYSLKVSSSSADGAYYVSKEGTAGFAPQLIVTTSTGSGSTATPTMTSILTKSPTPSITSTSNPTSTPTPTSVTSTGTSTSTAGPANSFTFAPSADAYVKAANPSTNYGTSTTLRTDNSPIVRSYLRFNVQGLSTTVKRATLRIFANTSSSSGFMVYRLADNTWAEGTLNYSNAPAAGAQIGTSGSVTSSRWITVDVTSYITGNGTFNFILSGASATEISLASREAATNAPQLIVETGVAALTTPSASPTVIPAASATFTPSPTLGPIVTPSRTLTAILTSTPSNTPAPASTFTATSTPAVGTFTFGPSADAYVNEASPATNYGTLTTVRADGSPLVRSYMRFDVQGLSGSVSRVTLRIFTNSSSNAGYEVRNVVDNSWNELTINFSNAPAVEGVTVGSGPFASGVWTTVDITPLITGNGSFNIALTTTSATAFSLASREAGTSAPQLVIETSP